MIPKEKSKTVNPRRTENVMVKRKRTNINIQSNTEEVKD
jgi:hypothetical protein